MKKLHLFASLALLACTAVQAANETPKPTTLVKVDGFPVTNLHFAIFNAQNGGKDDTQQEQIALLNELVNTFMVANSAEGKALAKNPEVAAAIDVAKARLTAQALIQEHLQNAKVPEEQVQAAYAEEYADAPKVELQARHILLKTEDEAKAVIAELDKGADFAKLAKEKSTGPSARAGGDLGWFTPDQMVAPFSKAALKLKDGEYTETPVKTQFGWHVILREKSRETPPPSLDMVRDEIVKKLRTRSLAKFVRGLRDKAKIEVVGADAKATK
jgi:peptidyl-prolyl cis-trans isomerase C